jgi:hypothetical protein
LEFSTVAGATEVLARTHNMAMEDGKCVLLRLSDCAIILPRIPFITLRFFFINWFAVFAFTSAKER